MFELVTAVLIVLCASALSSGTEAALFSVPLVKVRQLAQSKKSSGRALLAIRQNMSRPIASIVIMNNIANIVGSIVVGRIAAVQLGSEFLGAFSALLTFLVIIFAEIIPKTLGERFAETIALSVARPVQILTLIFTPLVWAIEKLTYPITKGRAAVPTTNEAEIKLLARIGRQEGIIEEDESEMIQRVFRLNDVTAGDMMTPRVAMTYLWGDSTLAEVKGEIIASEHSRIIIVGETIDDVVGSALKTDLLTTIIDGKEDLPVSALAREALFVPENVHGDKLLQVFQKKRRHLAVVIDEFGGVAGVVTLEDVLETLTGEIVDETDLAADLQAEAKRRNKSLLMKVLSSPDKS
ncbi:MAG: HlyC/CorC family transporter [Anaerolineae bacterium]|nr:HlyC/CorC family transporter [Anaerolineae bacterium]